MVRSIAFAEPDSKMRADMSFSLGKAGFEVVEFSNGRDAKLHFEDESIDAFVIKSSLFGECIEGSFAINSDIYSDVYYRVFLRDELPQQLSDPPLEGRCLSVPTSPRNLIVKLLSLLKDKRAID